MEVIKGYKVFNPDWTASDNNFRYKVGKEYAMDSKTIPCERGFFFWKELKDCLNDCDLTSSHKVAEVEGFGEIWRNGNEICCSRIRIVMEIPMSEAIHQPDNIGIGNNGESNRGLFNDGNENCGGFNQGVSNRGDFNHGNCNYGFNNQGSYNLGNYNRGSCNRGDRNWGNSNLGNDNTGNDNLGNSNQGNYNQGNNNKGIGNYGNCNRGKNNIGIGNKGDNIIGLFCTQEQPFYLFNKICYIPRWEFMQSESYYLLMRLAKAKNPKKEWEKFTYTEKRITQTAYNFDPEVFKELFDIDIRTT